MDEHQRLGAGELLAQTSSKVNLSNRPLHQDKRRAESATAAGHSPRAGDWKEIRTGVSTASRRVRVEAAYFSSREAILPVHNDAHCVSMTEVKNRKNPLCTWMLASPPDFTVSTRIATMKTSSMDHLPRFDTNL